MPELPEVETVRRGLDTHIRGEIIVSVRVANRTLRQPVPKEFEKRILGQKIEAVSRRAKYLVIQLSGDDVLLSHLGMSGCFKVIPETEQYTPVAHDHVWLCFESGKQLIYNDPRRFGMILPVKKLDLAQHALLEHLGPEPLEPAFSPLYLKRMLEARKAPVKAAIMDQELVVGVGNIYACEALFKTGLNPRMPACEAASKAKKLHAAIVAVLRDALASGGSSLKDFYNIEGKTGYFQHHFAVYGRENAPCTACATEIVRITQSGRSTFFCPRCQKWPQVTGRAKK